MALTIERVDDLDAAFPDIRSLLVELMEFHRPWFYRELHDGWEETYRSYIALGDDRLILIARDDGTAVAFLNASVRNNVAIFDEAYGFIDDAFVDERYRHRGLGRDLLARTETWFRERKVSEVRLQVVVANELGVSFWTGAGYTPLTQIMHKTLEVA